MTQTEEAIAVAKADIERSLPILTLSARYIVTYAEAFLEKPHPVPMWKCRCVYCLAERVARRVIGRAHTSSPD